MGTKSKRQRETPSAPCAPTGFRRQSELEGPRRPRPCPQPRSPAQTHRRSQRGKAGGSRGTGGAEVTEKWARTPRVIFRGSREMRTAEQCTLRQAPLALRHRRSTESLRDDRSGEAQGVFGEGGEVGHQALNAVRGVGQVLVPSKPRCAGGPGAVRGPCGRKGPDRWHIPRTAIEGVPDAGIQAVGEAVRHEGLVPGLSLA